MTAVAWMVLYGDRQQFKALFCERARAEQFAATHGGHIISLVSANAELKNNAPADLRSNVDTA